MMRTLVLKVPLHIVHHQQWDGLSRDSSDMRLRDLKKLVISPNH